MKTRTLIITLALFCGLVLAGVGAYYVFLSGSGASRGGSQTEQPIFGQIPEGQTSAGGTSGEGFVVEGGSSEAELPGEASTTPRLRPLSAKPVSGYAAFAATSSGEFVRYVERESGNIYEANFENSEVKRVTNTTIPKTYGAFWLDSPGSVILRLLSDTDERIETFLGRVSASGEGGSLGGNYLENDILAIAPDTRGKQLLYVRKENQGSSAIIENVSAGKRTKIFSSPLSEWLPYWLGSTPLLLSKPSGSAPGYLYSVSPSTGSVSRLLGDIGGLTVLPSPDGKRILWSESIGSTIFMHVLTVATGKTVDAAVATIPDKCVWSVKKPSVVLCAVPYAVSGDTSGTYPDLWYQGRASFSDNLWRIDAVTGASMLLYRFSSETTRSFDAEHLSLSPNEDELLLQNKKDLSLWSVRLGSPAATSTSAF